MTQLDMLALLDETATAAPVDRDAAVLAWYLAPWQLNDAVRALTKPRAGAWAAVRSALISGQQGSLGGTRSWTTERDGVHVRAWPGQSEPWVIPWARAAEVIRDAAHHAGPGPCAALHEAVVDATQHRLSFRGLPFTAHRDRTAETDAAEGRWWAEHGQPHHARQRQLDAAVRAAADRVLRREAWGVAS